ncbi:MAG: helix-turn-helix transcriptional regulator [Chloroflexi bacterium]|nr:helix-turn-helix transcriptional regulator [Chloroflexota bacterium]
MNFIFDERSSDSPFVDTIWRTQSESGGSFISLAESHWGMVVTRQNGKTYLTVRGPETKAMPAPVPENAEFFGIIFKLGTFMPHLPARNLVDGETNLPDATSQSFWLHGSAWQFPDYENADTFVERLVREGLLVHEPVVEAALQSQLKELSLRSVQRRFLQATGLTHGTVCQIERARHALVLLQQGVSILDTVDQAGYADQPHLTRSLKHFIGQTPAQIIRLSQPE